MNFFNKKKKLVYVFFAALLIFVIGVSYKLYVNYKDSEIWEHTNEIPLADLDPALIYLDTDSQQKVKEYTYLENQIWDGKTGDFKNSKNLNKLMNYYKKAYDSLGDELKKYAKNYNRISSLYPIKQNYDNLVIDNEIKYNEKYFNNLLTEESWETINKELLSNEPNQFAKNIYQNLIYIGKDSVIIDTILDKFNEVYEIKDKNIIVKENKTFSDLNGVKELSSKLHFKWNDILSPIQNIINKSSEILNDNQKRNEEISNLENKINEFKNIKQNIEVLKNTIDLEDFTGKSLEDVEKWSLQNNIKLEKTYTDVINENQNNKIISQYPNKNEYDKIVKNTTIKISVGKYQVSKKVEQELVKNKKEDILTEQNENKKNISMTEQDVIESKKNG